MEKVEYFWPFFGLFLSEKDHPKKNVKKSEKWQKKIILFLYKCTYSCFFHVFFSNFNGVFFASFFVICMRWSFYADIQYFHPASSALVRYCSRQCRKYHSSQLAYSYFEFVGRRIAIDFPPISGISGYFQLSFSANIQYFHSASSVHALSIRYMHI